MRQNPVRIIQAGAESTRSPAVSLVLMIAARRLYNLGIGLTDAHLIASVLIDAPTLLWTKDKRLRQVAEALGTRASLP
jgi:hypothetical protein